MVTNSMSKDFVIVRRNTKSLSIIQYGVYCELCSSGGIGYNSFKNLCNNSGVKEADLEEILHDLNFKGFVDLSYSNNKISQIEAL
jgi:hypothetical protein